MGKVIWVKNKFNITKICTHMQIYHFLALLRWRNAVLIGRGTIRS